MELSGWIALIAELEKLDPVAYYELGGRLKALVSLAQERSLSSDKSRDSFKEHPSKGRAGNLLI